MKATASKPATVNLIAQIKRVLNRHSEDLHFMNLVKALENVSIDSDIDDVIFETADSLCPIYYAELKEWIPEHIDEINDAVRDNMISPEDFDLFKVAQMAWVQNTEAEFFECREDVYLVVALRYLTKHVDNGTVSLQALAALKDTLNQAPITQVVDILDVTHKTVISPAN